MITLSHPTGNQFVRALLAGLHEAGELETFFTTVATRGGRRHYELTPDKIRTRPCRELLRLGAQRFGLNFLISHETGWASTDAVYRDLDRTVARWIASQDGSGPVYCYEDGALETFRAARLAGRRTCYELPIAYWETSRRLLQEEAARLPQWEPTLLATRDSEEKLARKTEELALADRMICPSRFVWESLPAWARAKCTIAEFGSPGRDETGGDDIPGVQGQSYAEKRTSGTMSPPWQGHPGKRHRERCLHLPQSQPLSGSRLRILFAGSLSQRKGLADLFTAMQLLNRSDIELVLMGSPLMPMQFYRSQYPDFVYEPPRPHSAVLDLMGTCDLLVLPSIVEGRALVQQEALRCGLPLLVTAHAGGADLIDEGKTGFLLPIRSPEAIAEKIAWFADHRPLLPAMREAAQKKAAEYTWERYVAKIVRVIV